MRGVASLATVESCAAPALTETEQIDQTRPSRSAPADGQILSPAHRYACLWPAKCPHLPRSAQPGLARLPTRAPSDNLAAWTQPGR